MDNKSLYMYILMFLALLIGFLIGWILKRSAYKKRYQKKINKLEYQEEEYFEKLKKIETNLTDLKNLNLDNKDSLRIKNERLDTHVTQDVKLNMEIVDIQKENDILLKDIPVLDEHINDALADLEKVKNARNSFLEQIEEVNSLDKDIAELNRDIDSIEMLVPSALQRQNKLSLSVTNINEHIIKKDAEIDKINSTIDDIKEEYERKRFSTDLEFQESMIEKERYKSILIKIEQKMEDGEVLSKNDFKGLINGNKSSWFGGIYKKSINLLKGEK